MSEPILHQQGMDSTGGQLHESTSHDVGSGDSYYTKGSSGTWSEPTREDSGATVASDSALLMSRTPEDTLNEMQERRATSLELPGVKEIKKKIARVSTLGSSLRVHDKHGDPTVSIRKVPDDDGIKRPSPVPLDMASTYSDPEMLISSAARSAPSTAKAVHLEPLVPDIPLVASPEPAVPSKQVATSPPPTPQVDPPESHSEMLTSRPDNEADYSQDPYNMAGIYDQLNKVYQPSMVSPQQQQAAAAAAAAAYGGYSQPYYYAPQYYQQVAPPTPAYYYQQQPIPQSPPRQSRIPVPQTGPYVSVQGVPSPYRPATHYPFNTYQQTQALSQAAPPQGYRPVNYPSAYRATSPTRLTSQNVPPSGAIMHAPVYPRGSTGQQLPSKQQVTSITSPVVTPPMSWVPVGESAASSTFQGPLAAVETTTASPPPETVNRTTPAHSAPQEASYQSTAVGLPGARFTPAGIASPPRPRHSEWAMWVGNLPNETTSEMLQDYFDEPAMESVFLIARSNCAFVNYSSKEALDSALVRFQNAPFFGAHLVVRTRKLNPDPHHAAHAYHSRHISDAASPALRSPLQDRRLSSTSSSSTGHSPLPPRPPNQPDSYFILKSLTRDDLDISAQNGMWATQPHNEPILNRAFHEGENVYLIFSANKSGEFFGIARMVSAIGKESETSPTSPVQWSQVDHLGAAQGAGGTSSESPHTGTSTDEPTSDTATAEEGKTEVEGRGEIQGEDEGAQVPRSWGMPFKIQWLSLNKVPFNRTRHLKNPWNGQREVKISRDGTEVEPSVGKRLFEEFFAAATSSPDPAATTMGYMPAPSTMSPPMMAGLGLPSDVMHPTTATAATHAAYMASIGQSPMPIATPYQLGHTTGYYQTITTGTGQYAVPGYPVMTTDGIVYPGYVSHTTPGPMMSPNSSQSGNNSQ